MHINNNIIINIKLKIRINMLSFKKKLQTPKLNMIFFVIDICYNCGRCVGRKKRVASLKICLGQHNQD
jgi:hypothetical protein